MSGPSASWRGSPGSSRRGGPALPRGFRERVRANWKPGLFIILLSCIIWWAAKQRVETTVRVESRARLEVELNSDDPELVSRYAVLRQPMHAPALRLTGPQDEINRFQELLGQRRDGALYRLKLTSADIGSRTPDAEHQLALDLQLQRFEGGLDLTPPGEVNVALAEPERSVRIVLEARVTRDAEFDTSGIAAPPAYTATVDVKTPVRAKGPWSRLKPTLRTGSGNALLRLAPVNLDAELGGLLKDPAHKQDLLSKPVARTVGIQPIEGIEFSGADDRPLDAVNIEMTLKERVEFVLERRSIPVDLALPRWMMDKRVEVESLDGIRELSVELLVDPASRERFTPENVALVLDLARVRPDQLVMLSDTPAGVRTGRIVNAPVRLRVDRAALSYRLPPGSRGSEEEYAACDVTVTWQEGQG